MTAGASPAGTVLSGRYRLAERVGAGGMAEVYRAEDVVLGRPVTIKMLHPAIDSTGPAQQRLRSEVQLLARLSHPGLVQVYDTGDEAGRAFLVMQLVDGGTLAGRLASGPMPPDDVAGVGAELADVLAYLHAQGMVHRDLKPSNVLLDGTAGRALLTDFGIARALDATHLTATNTAVGTAAYMAPEQVQGQEVGPPGDIYALGLILIQCLSGTPVYQGSNFFEVAAARLHRQPQIPPGAVNAGLSDLLGAMTRRDPSARPTAEQIAAGLGARGYPAADRAGPNGTAALPLLTEECPAPPTPLAERLRTWRQRSRVDRHARVHGLSAASEHLCGLWQRRGTATIFGVRADLAIGGAILLLAVLTVVFVATTGSDSQPQTTPPPPPPATDPPGADRLPADLDRLAEAVTRR